LPRWARIALRALPAVRLMTSKEELTIAQNRHHEPPPLIGRVALVVAPAAERDQRLEIPVGAALGALEHVVVVPTTHTEVV
jgi:hypothetical protein